MSSEIRQVVYLSRAVKPFAAGELLELLQRSRARNSRAGITGLLLHRNGTFMQLIEGPARRVEGLLFRISMDRRHTNMTILSDRLVQERLFPDSSMGFEEVEQVVPNNWPGLSPFIQPSLSFDEWVDRGEVALSFFESCANGAWPTRMLPN